MKQTHRKLIVMVCFFLFTITIGFISYQHRSGIKACIIDYVDRIRIAIKYDNTFAHKEPVTPEKRYLSIGFDDFRPSDFSMVEPLFRSYGAKATYNRIAYKPSLSAADRHLISALLVRGNELGDHTWFHCNYLYTDPLCNGQEYGRTDGDQQPFPSNDQLRVDCGDGKNAFGFDINQPVCESGKRITENGLVWSEYQVPWKNLSDEQCQQMRDSFSIYKDTSGKLATLDALSNQYCGTSGSSFGSWNPETGCYTGGIFTGCKTSCNHEIWERVLALTAAFYREQYSSRLSMHTWSWPGDPRSPFVFPDDQSNFYYDTDHTLLYNYLARFPSTLYVDQDNKPKYRSWTDVLREYGYTIAHDTWFPSRADGTETVMMSKQLILNASLSRQDALVYRTGGSVSYLDIASDYPEDFFQDQTKSVAAQMYDAGRSFYRFIESIRHNTANGMIHGEIIDSEDTASERVFLQQMLEYCKQTGVQVISKAEAYDICFNHSLQSGNLIYNPNLRNTAREFMPDSEKVPDNPDGYQGACKVITTMESGKSIPVLQVSGETVYTHYGIPLGGLTLRLQAKGKGKICIYGIKNATPVDATVTSLDCLAENSIDHSDFMETTCVFQIPDHPIEEYEQICEGYGNKYMGIKIVYDGNMEIRNIDLQLSQPLSASN